jgi:hypothetical protein
MISWSLFKDISCCVCRSFFSWSSSDFLPFPLHKRKRVVIFPWKRRRTIGYSYIDGVEKIHTVLLLLLMRQDSICCCRVRERREKRRKITFCCYSFQLTGRRNENFQDFIFVVVVVCFSFENEQLIDQPTLKLLGGGMGVAPYASVYMYSRRSSYCS